MKAILQQHKQYLLTGVSYVIPFIACGGILIALSLAYAFRFLPPGPNGGPDLTNAPVFIKDMALIGGQAFDLFPAVLAGFIAYAMAGKPGLVPGFIGGAIAGIKQTVGDQHPSAGFLGALLIGLVAGHVVNLLKRMSVPKLIKPVMPIIIIPIISSLVVGCLMLVLDMPIAGIMVTLNTDLQSMQSGSQIVLAMLLGAMIAFDMGGPVNKAAYTFSVGLLASNVFGPMAAVMAAGMTPPLAIALATLLFRNRFSAFERNEGKVTAILGLSFVTEGAIPFAAADPIRVIPCLVAGSALTGAISMASGCKLMVPHGGAFVLLIPHAVAGLPAYALAIVSGALLSGLLLGIVKKKNIEAV